ncbi:MAG TPA: methyltransferase domain-containing protein [Gemmatimonadaceae bacterium]|nr:methyltransferase domain-containing protein [Gemmatimonadaceae bacterium]
MREVAGPDDLRREVELLWAFHTRRLRPDTPPEHLADRVAFSQRPPLRLMQCADCGLVFRHPRPRAYQLQALYAAEAPRAGVLESLYETQRASYRAQAERLTVACGGRGTGLEVGSYAGAFLAAAAEQGWRFEGLDINEHATAFARAHGFNVMRGDLPSLDQARRYDAVAIWNCFEQLPDPRQAAAAARALLGARGVLAVRVPNGAFYLAIRPWLSTGLAWAARALLAHNNLLSFPYRHGFTVRSLTALLEHAGFRIQRVIGDTLVPIADEWTRPWAAVEERALKVVLRRTGCVGPLRARWAPWLEVYARVAC